MLKDIKNNVPFQATSSALAVHLEFDPPLPSEKRVRLLQNSMGEGGKFATFYEKAYVGNVMDVNVLGVIPGQQIMVNAPYEPVVAKVFEQDQ